MKLSKNKIKQLLKVKNQSRKRLQNKNNKNNKKNFKRVRTARLKKHMNLRHKTLRRRRGGGPKGSKMLAESDFNEAEQYIPEEQFDTIKQRFLQERDAIIDVLKLDLLELNRIQAEINAISTNLNEPNVVLPVNNPIGSLKTISDKILEDVNTTLKNVFETFLNENVDFDEEEVYKKQQALYDILFNTERKGRFIIVNIKAFNVYIKSITTKWTTDYTQLGKPNVIPITKARLIDNLQTIITIKRGNNEKSCKNNWSAFSSISNVDFCILSNFC